MLLILFNVGFTEVVPTVTGGGGGRRGGAGGGGVSVYVCNRYTVTTRMISA